MDNKKGLRAVFADRAKEGLWNQNPTLVLMLGMCPTLATTTSVESSLGMGMLATMVLILTSVVISAIRKHVPPQIRIAVFVAITAAFVTVIDLLIQAFLPSMSASLGIFIPLIVVNCIILARAESYASKNPPHHAAIDALMMGAGFTAALFAMGTVREVFGNGTFFGINLTGGWYTPMTALVMPAGGFLVLGFLIAAMKRVKRGARE